MKGLTRPSGTSAGGVRDAAAARFRTLSLASTSLRALLLGAAALALGESALAQSTADPDARYALIGPGSVDPKTGYFSYDATDLSVGTGSFPGTLELKRWQRLGVNYGLDRPMGHFEHNFEISTGCEGGQMSIPHPCYGRRAVRIGPTAYLFILTAANTWTSAYGEGAGLVEDSTRFIFRGPQGDQIIFPKSSSFYNVAGTVNLASSWQMADGESVTFSYEIALKAINGWNPRRRLTQVVNSRGYGLKFNYLLPGNGTPASSTIYGYNSTDWRRITVASVDAIAPGCVPGPTVVSCDTGQLGHVYYGYTALAGSAGMRMDWMQGPDGHISQFQWNSYGYVVSETNPASPGSFHFQNVLVGGLVAQQIDARGKSWLFRRSTDEYGTVMAEVEDPLHGITRYRYLFGMTAPEWVEDPAGRRTKYIYDATGREASVETALGRKTTYVYDDRGNLTRTTWTPAPGLPAAQTQLSVTAAFPPCDAVNWKICNKPASVTDERGATTEFTYSPDHGGTLAVLGPSSGTAGSRSLVKYDYATFTRAPGAEASSPAAPLPDVTLMTSSETCLSSNDTISYVCPLADSIVTAFSYMPSTPTARSQHLLSRVTADPIGIAAATIQRYDIVGNVVQVDGPRSDSDVTNFAYNLRRLTTGATGPDPDGAGPLAAPQTSYDYDAAGGATVMRQSIGSSQTIVTTTLDAAGRPVQVTDPQSGTVNLTYDDAGRHQDVAQTVEGVARVTRKVYDISGRLTQVRSAVGTPLEQATVSYTYDPDGSILTQSDAKGNTTSYCYDGFGRLIEARYPSTATPGTSPSCAAAPPGTLTGNYEAFGYDPAGNVVSTVLRDGRTVNFQYDAINRVKYRDMPEADRDITYGYDLAGRMTSASLPGTNAGLSVSWNHDKLGRIVTTTSNGRALNYSYAPGQVSTALTWPDGQSATFHSDAQGRMTRIYGLPAAGSPLLATYVYDQLSRPTAIQRGNAATSTSFGYDAQKRLLSLTHDFAPPSADAGFAYTYNEAGQLKTRTRDNDLFAWTGAVNASRTYQADGRNQYIVAGGQTPTYDGRGNLTGDGSSTYTYDTDNRLVASTTPSGSATLAYDAIGRLARITSGTSTTNFLYDGENMVGEYNSAGALLRRYVHGAGVDEPIVWYEGAGAADPRWLYADERGSVIAVANAGGSLTAANRYDEWGLPAGTNLGRFQYTGQLWLPEAGLYHYKARNYSPILGRFLQVDPIGFAGGMNLYAYVGNDPVNLRDPSGLWPYPDIIVCGNCGPRPDPSGPNVPSPGSILGTLFDHAQAGRDALNAALRNLAKRLPLTGPSQGRGHYYQRRDRLCDGSRSKCHVERVNSRRCVLPGRIGTQPIKSGAQYAVYGSAYDVAQIPFFVRSYQTGRYSFRNQTSTFHAFAGRVDRVFEKAPDGSVWVTTTGRGKSLVQALDDWNEELGPKVFAAQNKLCAELVTE
jgi:RHS repeat-associated protein